MVTEKCLQENLEKITTLRNQNIKTEEIEQSVLHIMYLIDNIAFGKF